MVNSIIMTLYVLLNYMSFRASSVGFMYSYLKFFGKLYKVREQILDIISFKTIF